MQERKWVINKIIPVVVSANILIPTVPKMNKGPELFVKQSSLSASYLLQMPSFLKFVTIFAPTG